MAHDVPTHSALIKRESRNAVVAYVKEECLNNPNPKYLNDMLDVYLDPTKAIDDYDSITWCKWLIAGGPNYDLFAKKGKTLKVGMFNSVRIRIDLLHKHILVSIRGVC